MSLYKDYLHQHNLDIQLFHEITKVYDADPEDFVSWLYYYELKGLIVNNDLFIHILDLHTEKFDEYDLIQLLKFICKLYVAGVDGRKAGEKLKQTLLKLKGQHE